MDVHLLGIRHHGPGSAKSVRAALTALEPDILLIEAPSDVEPLLAHAGHADLRPPVAMLAYDPKDFSRAAYYPFAEFSPEWQAIQYGLRRNIPIRFMDLPASNTLVFDQNDRENNADLFGAERMETLRHDPLGEMARLAGYTDGERWWEVTFEQEGSGPAIFEAVAELMDALRREFPSDDPLTLAREAYMRESLRKAGKEDFRRAAVVCGAWHVPALQSWDVIPSSKDKALLRGLARTKASATWAPWTYERLSSRTGYRAGVIAPFWYMLLFSNRPHAVTRWMTTAARLLRGADMDASSALVIDAVILAESLATLRGRKAPGLDELREAAWSTLCEGNPEKLALIEEKLIMGEAWGKVPGSIPLVPLQKDLEACIQSARLSKEYRITEAVDKDLDLRKETHRLASQLLHRLHILEIPWGRQKKGSRFKTGSFSEHWKLKWLPDYSIRVIEAGMWGNTVAEAASNWLIRRAGESQDLGQLAAWLEEALRAGLEAPLPALTARIQEQAALLHDILRLIDALGPLVEVWRYGDTRGTAVEAVDSLIRELAPRICIGLPATAMSISDELAGEVFNRLLEMNRLLGLLNLPEFLDLFGQSLESLSKNSQVHPLLQGTASRLLFDKGKKEAGDNLYFHLSNRQEPLRGAQWLEGFLHGSGLLLLHYPPLWQALDNWVADLSMEQLADLLPILRRTFSRFSVAERSKMLELARFGNNRSTAGAGVDERRAGKMGAFILQLLGEN
jgi:hypothetical protein